MRRHDAQLAEIERKSAPILNCREENAGPKAKEKAYPPPRPPALLRTCARSHDCPDLLKHALTLLTHSSTLALTHTSARM